MKLRASILFFADVETNAKKLFKIESNNNITTQLSKCEIGPVSNIDKFCPWIVFIARCNVLPGTNAVSIRKPPSTSSISVQFEIPDRKPRGIVACYAPMFFEERWHVITVAHELNAVWGVDLQVHYVQSAAGDLLRLLEPLIKKGLLEIRGIDITDFGERVKQKLGYDPVENSEFRQQIMAHQDCFFRYRESAEFIVIGDVDDVFVPTHGQSLMEEFTYWKKLHPTASGFIYARTNGHAIVSDRIHTFDYKSTIESIRQVNNSNEIAPKTVYNPKYAETPWIHWPGITKTPPIRIPHGEGLCLHVHYFYGAKHEQIPQGKNLSNFADLYLIIRNPVLNYTLAAATMKSLPTPPFPYASAIYKCYTGFSADKKLRKEGSSGKYCPTPTICSMPKRNISCTVAVRSYEMKCLNRSNLCVFVEKDKLKLVERKTGGCTFGKNG
uniref:Glycosyltransferase family 92 protein n=1 Tax=Panagrellus redivivus TaxID=6233 RepID=A0A7E4VUT3_PANRE